MRTPHEVFGDIQGDTDWLLKEEGPPPPVGSEHIHAPHSLMFTPVSSESPAEEEAQIKLVLRDEVMNTVARLPGNCDSRGLRVTQLASTICAKEAAIAHRRKLCETHLCGSFRNVRGIMRACSRARFECVWALPLWSCRTLLARAFVFLYLEEGDVVGEVRKYARCVKQGDFVTHTEYVSVQTRSTQHEHEKRQTNTAKYSVLVGWSKAIRRM